MNLFLPAGWEKTWGKTAFYNDSYFTGVPIAQQTYDAASTILLKNQFLALIARSAGGVSAYEIPFVATTPLLNIPKTSRLDLTIYFGKTAFSATLEYLRTYYYFVSVPQPAIGSGVIRVSLYAGNTLISSAETSFDRLQFSVNLKLDNVGQALPDNTNGIVVYEFVSDLAKPFGDVENSVLSGSYPIVFVQGNIESLSAKLTTAGQTVTDEGPISSATSSAALSYGVSNALAAPATASAVAFANIEVDEEINLRARILATAQQSANLSGPVELSALGIASVSSTALQKMDLAFNAAAVCGVRSFALGRYGVPIFFQAAASASATIAKKTLTVSARVSGMTLYVNLETRSFIVSPVLNAPVTSLQFTRRDTEAIDVVFVRNSRPVELSFGASGVFAVKNEYDGQALALDGEWSQRGEGVNSRYQFALNLNTNSLNALFPTDEEASVSAKVELQWVDGDTVNTTLPCAAIIHNDVIRDGEGVPTVTAAASFKLLASDSSLWTITIGPDGILTATK
jgi:hypothetical protein